MQIRIIPAAEVHRKILEAIGAISFAPDSAVTDMLLKAVEVEQDETRKDVLSSMLTNIHLARENKIPLCQDTGTLVVFAYIGNRVVIDGAPLQVIINQALAEATAHLYLRASILIDPLFNRVNSGNNCHAVLHLNIVDGDELTLMIAQKGGGAENMSRLKMFSPDASPEEIEQFVMETVTLAGAKACPPLVIGIGIGGNFEVCAKLAKQALFSPISKEKETTYSAWETRIQDTINKSGIGVQGMGGQLTALAVNILCAPCHIASLPVAVNLQCHAHRHITIRM